MFDAGLTLSTARLREGDTDGRLRVVHSIGEVREELSVRVRRFGRDRRGVSMPVRLIVQGVEPLVDVRGHLLGQRHRRHDPTQPVCERELARAQVLQIGEEF